MSPNWAFVLFLFFQNKMYAPLMFFPGGGGKGNLFSHFPFTIVIPLSISGNVFHKRSSDNYSPLAIGW